jgi:hypothetical protein
MKRGGVVINAEDIAKEVTIEVTVKGVLPLKIKLWFVSFFLHLATFVAKPWKMEVHIRYVKSRDKSKDRGTQGRTE